MKSAVFAWLCLLFCIDVRGQSFDTLQIIGKALYENRHHFDSLFKLARNPKNELRRGVNCGSEMGMGF